MRSTRVLLFAIALWTAAIVLSGAATSFNYLLAARTFLGAVASATPVVASLAGDFFPAHRRAHVYSLILVGELLGTALGFVLAGLVSSWFNWRWAFCCRALLSGALAWAVWRYLPEPERGIRHWLPAGDNGSLALDGTHGAASKYQNARESARRAAQKAKLSLHLKLVLNVDPTSQSFWWTLR